MSPVTPGVETGLKHLHKSLLMLTYRRQLQQLAMVAVGLAFTVTALPIYAKTSPPTPAPPRFAAKRLVASPPITKLNQQEVYRYTIGFQNTGTAVWQSDGPNTVAIETTERVRVEHRFASAAWLDKTTVTTLTTDEVKHGEVGFFTLTLQAPSRAGAYTNRFALFAGSRKITGTDFTIPMTVSRKIAPPNKRTVTAAPPPGSAVALTMKTLPYVTAKRMLQSDQILLLAAGETKQFQIGFQNAGERNWRDGAPSAVALTLDPASVNVNLADGSWLDPATPTTLKLPLVKPGEIGFFSFTLKAPPESGAYSPQFRLVMNGSTLVAGSEFRLPVTVTAPPPPSPALALNPTSPSGAAPTIVCAAALDETVTAPTNGDQSQLSNEPGTCTPAHTEPTMRVGLASVQGQLGVTANGSYAVADSNGQVLMPQVEAGVTVFLAFDPISRTYTAVGPGPIITSPLPLHVRALTEPSVITLITFSNPAVFDAAINDNTYRGSIELQWSDNDQKLWIINELKMEEYLPGIAETGNGSPHEYQKAIITAARTYALYHHETKLKHQARHFDVIATVGDQYYRGYNSEQRLPNIAAAVRETRGQVVTYQGQVVVTPYSASTDGTSHSWEEVWGGTPKPWLPRQPIPEDAGRRMNGHGVGLSQLAAADQAKAGKNYVDILKFFYVGTEVAQWYN